jgi:translation initiation factor 1
MRRPITGGLVYSTEAGRICPVCAMPADACTCKARAAGALQGDGQVRVSRDRKGRGGKVVTIVRGLPLDAAALVLMGKELRSACGAGGTVKDGAVEVQGDHLARVLELLIAKGFKARQSGG